MYLLSRKTVDSRRSHVVNVIVLGLFSIGCFLIENSFFLIGYSMYHSMLQCMCVCSQMTSKWVTDKTAAHEAIAEYVADVLTTF